ncbi:hypothetical protein EUGRSUZ_J00797 [Eucalyptus grandis]|uniref:Uncharacterized protein n=2 Tax=Eucalyptus grandis TaxID=71139 RepID=A0ACC3J3L1_EUCGR|nr:hypothetical protein EUGRSUZ_J00797 [Eucalyptus grandis]
MQNFSLLSLIHLHSIIVTQQKGSPHLVPIPFNGSTIHGNLSLSLSIHRIKAIVISPSLYLSSHLNT